jgi:hypothetical protein
LSKDGKKVYFTAAVDGTKTFEVNFPGLTKSQSVQQVTKGDFDVNDLVGFTSNSIIIVSRRYEPCFRNFSLT